MPALDPAYLPLLQTLAGGLLAILGGFTSSHLIERGKAKREARSTLGAIRGEIGAILAIVEVRGYERSLVAFAEAARDGAPDVPISTFQVTRSYFKVYDALCSKLGVLDEPLPSEIARFYTLINAILEDVGAGSALELDALSVSDRAKLASELLNLWAEAKACGHAIIGPQAVTALIRRTRV